MAKRKKNLSITDTIAQHLETTNPETVVIPEVTEEKPALNEEPKEEVIEKKEEGIEVMKEETIQEEQKPKEKILVSPHHKDSATSAINLSISSVF